MTSQTENSEFRRLSEPRAVVEERLPGGGIHFRTTGWEPQVFIRGDARIGKVFRPNGVELFPCLPDVRLVADQPNA